MHLVLFAYMGEFFGKTVSAYGKRERDEKIINFSHLLRQIIL